MGETRKGEDLLGDKISRHYDNQKDKIGTSRTKEDLIGNEFDQHRDADGNKTGTSHSKTDWAGDEYTQHRSNDGTTTGSTRTKSGILGGDYEQHYDAAGNKTGYTEYRTDIFGDKVAVHHDMNGNRVDHHVAISGQPGTSRESRPSSDQGPVGDSWIDRIMSFLFHFSRTIDNGETPISYISPAAMIIGLIYYVVEVFQTWSVSAMEGIAALLIAWIIIPIFGVIAAAVAGVLVIIKKIVRKNQTDA